MVRIAVAGASGRMGQQLIKAIDENDQTTLASAIIRTSSDTHTLRTLISPSQITTSLPTADHYDVMIDFTHASATQDIVAHAIDTDRPLVLGTTGYDDAVAEQIKKASQSIPILTAANYSRGVNVTLKLLKKAAQALNGIADIEVVEAHHRHKVDAPSGTALAMGEVMAEAIGKRIPEDAVFARVGQTGEREEGSIGFSTIRGGDIVGEHTVYFVMNGERIEITHRAMDRMIFARGAVSAAEWLAHQRAGRYDMDDVLSLNA